MIWPVRGLGRRFAVRHARRRSAYTLIEILVSTALTLMLLMAVVQIFASVSDSIANSRAALEMADQLRAAQMTLQRDLEGVTVTMSPPRRPESGEGYFEYTEGPIGPAMSIDDVAKNTQTPSGAVEADSTVGDIDDMVTFTTRTRSTPFVGRVLVKRAPLTGETPTGDDGAKYVLVHSAESQEAEVIWFLRGRTLYRRVLLVLPNFDADLRSAGSVQMQLDSTAANYPVVSPAGQAFYRDYDISVRNADGGGALAANSLSDLTKPENRFAHRVTNGLPFHAHFAYSGTSIVRSNWANLGLPVLRECSFSGWVAGTALPAANLGTVGTFDAWLNPHPAAGQDKDTGALNDYLGTRIGEDVVLTNVIGFDVKAWDPGAPVMMLTANGPTLLPGDRGYLAAVNTYITNAQAAGTYPRPVGYGAYVDLNYLCMLGHSSGTAQDALPDYVDSLKPAGIPNPQFYWAGDKRSKVRGANPSTAPGSSPRSSVYDTWSTHYEYDGHDTDNRDGDDDGTTGADEGTDGFDSNGNGVVDDVAELEAPPPYAVPLRGIQVRIRVFDPASRQIREVTVVQDFLPK